MCLQACQANLWKAVDETSFVFSAEMPCGSFRILGTVQLSDPGGFSFSFPPFQTWDIALTNILFYQPLSHKFFLYDSSIKTKLEKLQILRWINILEKPEYVFKKVPLSFINDSNTHVVLNQGTWFWIHRHKTD